MERLAVMVCTGCGIGEGLNTEALVSLAGELGAATTKTHPAFCGPEGLKCLNEAIDAENADGVLICACSPRAKIEEFKLGREGLAAERVSLREQVVWSHPAGEEDTQMLAEDLVRMGYARLGKMSLPSRLDEQVCRTILVVGGGLTGLAAARAAAGCGHDVVLVEKSDRLGGYLAGVVSVPPGEPPYDRTHPSPVAELVAEVEGHSGIRVFKSARVSSIDGQPGQFTVRLQNGDGAEELRAGAIVQATGAQPYDAARVSRLGYADNPDVITSFELETMLARKELKRPSDGKPPQRVLFVQCAGSRDPEHLTYCSAECCLTTLKQVVDVHKLAPEVDATVVYRDMRTPAQTERFYQAVQEQPHTFLTRGDVEAVRADGNGALAVEVKNSLLGDDILLSADLVVLAVGMVANAADGEAIRIYTDSKKRSETADSEKQREEALKLVEKYKGHAGTEILHLGYRQGPDLPVLDSSFPDSHFICFPYETRRTGIYTAGTLRAPMGPAHAVEDGWGAAMKAMQCLVEAERGEAVHPRSGDISVPDFFLQRCTQCKRCTEECPFGTLNEDIKGTPQFNPLRCRRCGICMGACPERIINFAEYSVDAVASMVKAMEVPEDFEEKPRILALICENDALPALDSAAQLRKQWNPWVRIIPVRCLGSFNTVWIAEAMNRGIDGVILIGCKSGEDYQCHYVRGSELAQYRLGNVQETLERLSLEAERIKVVELAHDEFERIPQVLDEFAETLEELGPNPMKGF